MEIMSANRQWSMRPADERFLSIEAMHAAAVGHFESARERENIPLSSLRAEAFGAEVKLVGKGGIAAKLTNWAFGQLSARVGAPAAYLRQLPAALATLNLNQGLATRLQDEPDAVVNALFDVSGDITARCITSDRYSRFWNYELTERLLRLKGDGWDVARPDIRVQDDRLPLYVSDHDMFAFLAHNDRVIGEAGNPQGLKRGGIWENSEVGGGKLKFTRFLYREMCGNHIIWGASEVSEIGFRHVGNLRDRVQMWDVETRKYLDESATADEAKILAAQRHRIAGTKEEVLDALFSRKSLGLSRKTLTAGYDAVVPDQDGAPNMTWGIVQGLTRHSQTIKFADDRTAIDRAAGKLLEAF